MPFCHELKKHEGEIDYGEIEACYSKLRETDDSLSGKEIRIQLFGEKNADEYEYQPIVRMVEDLEDTENYFQPPYAISNLDLAYSDESPSFKVYDKKDGVRTEVVLNEFKRVPAIHQIHDKAPHCHQLQ